MIASLVWLKHFFMSILNFCFESYGSEYSCHNKKDYIDEHVRYHSHFINYFFYHLPTRGREGIKLGDADTSPMYL